MQNDLAAADPTAQLVAGTSDAAFPASPLPVDEGHIVADAYGGTILVNPPLRAMAAARRKALTLKFAQHAARLRF